MLSCSLLAAGTQQPTLAGNQEPMQPKREFDEPSKERHLHDVDIDDR